jgi:hypothetical protein
MALHNLHCHIESIDLSHRVAFLSHTCSNASRLAGHKIHPKCAASCFIIQKAAVQITNHPQGGEPSVQSAKAH